MIFKELKFMALSDAMLLNFKTSSFILKVVLKQINLLFQNA